MYKYTKFVTVYTLCALACSPTEYALALPHRFAHSPGTSLKEMTKDQSAVSFEGRQPYEGEAISVLPPLRAPRGSLWDALKNSSLSFRPRRSLYRLNRAQKLS